MESNKKCLSNTRLQRLRAQGYFKYSDIEITDLAFGNRFAFIVCGSLLGVGVATANIPLLSAMTVIAFGGIVLPYHPFDYIYNGILAGALDKPKLPPRSRQLKFACVMATCWLLGTIFLFYNGFYTAGYIAGALLFSVAFLVSTIDFCIPSMIYNFAFKIKIN